MRYRPFGNYRLSVSAVSLLVQENQRLGVRDWVKLLFGAVESGINTFEIVGGAPTVLEGVNQALGAIDRDMIFVSWRPPYDAGAGAAADIHDVLDASGLKYFDCVMLPACSALPAAQAFKGVRQARLMGIQGEDRTADHLMETGEFQAVTASYNLTSGWLERNRLKQAGTLNLAVIAHNFWPETVHPTKPTLIPKGLFRKKSREPLAGRGSYRFLEDTRGWTAEELCLGFALTEPGLSTIQFESDTIERIERMAQITDASLPTGVSAQIEMARFSNEALSAVAS